MSGMTELAFVTELPVGPFGGDFLCFFLFSFTVLGASQNC